MSTPTPPIDARALVQKAIEGLRKGEPAIARDSFQTIIDAGQADASVWLGLALALRGTGDKPGSLAAIDQGLALEPANLRGRLMKADHFAEAGDARAASAFYAAVVRHAPPPDHLPPDLRAEVARAQMMSQRYAVDYEAALRARLTAQGVPMGGRFGQSLDLMFGKKRIYLQEPKHYYFPELPQIQFYGREPFPWLAGLEAATADIRAELMEVMKNHADFTPYLESKTDRPSRNSHGMLDNPDWSAFYLWRNGEPVAENVARCPKTIAALAEVPLAPIKGRTPSVLFSLLRPGAAIPPHHGFVNTRLICHLPLIVPPGCSFRVGNETRDWKEGQAWLFDDTIEHEAWNRSQETRVILLFDVWRPELSIEERAMVAAMFEAVDAYGEGGEDWTM
ncbi:MAG: aspartyl/asparaginyl beta-hydroxylase domain-containing protein [Caulobacterales bacterium]|nr:aspartyl/asparaginyl beta-hydroxylase domain-containing protein [Caulobacterales bacterium]